MTSISNLFRSTKLAQAAAPEMAKLRKATEDFEAVLLKDIFAKMRDSGLQIEPPSHAMSIFRDMSDQAYAENAAQSGDFGVGKKLYADVAPVAAQQAYDRILRDIVNSPSNNQGTNV